MPDLRSILTRLRIEWRDRGPNTSREHVNICCPYCTDSHFHLSIHERSFGCRCFREGVRKDLIPTLVKISHRNVDEVRRLVAEARPSVHTKPAIPQGEKTDNLSSPLRLDSSSAEWHYLKVRLGVEPDVVDRMVDVWGLARFHIGRLSYRVAVPVTNSKGKQIGWSGRAIIPTQHPRYLMAGDTRAMASAVCRARTDLLARLMILVEGPFDALKISAVCLAGHLEGVVPVALLGSVVTEEKYMAACLEYHGPIAYLPDSDVTSFASAQKLNTLNSTAKAFGMKVSLAPRLPNSYKDAGDTPPKELWEWISRLLHDQKLMDARHRGS